MDSIQIEVIKDLQEAERLWNILSPKTSLNNEWSLRYCFYKYFNYELFFYTAYCDSEPVGILPLQYNSKKDYLEFFGDYEEWMDDNSVFTKLNCDFVIPQLYQAVDKKSNLTFINGDDPFTQNLPFQDNHYFLDLTSYKNVDDYLYSVFSRGTRKKMKRRNRNLEKLGVEVITNQLEDIEQLFELNISHFKEESSFYYPYRKEIFRDFLKLGYPIHLTTFIISGKKEAVSLSLGYKDTYVGINTGVNDTIPDIQAYVTLYKINQAIQLGYKKYDARGSDFGWKERWHLQKYPLYKYIKEDNS